MTGLYTTFEHVVAYQGTEGSLPTTCLLDLLGQICCNLCNDCGHRSQTGNHRLGDDQWVKVLNHTYVKV